MIVDPSQHSKASSSEFTRSVAIQSSQLPCAAYPSSVSSQVHFARTSGISCQTQNLEHFCVSNYRRHTLASLFGSWAPHRSEDLEAKAI